jgi:hypothetical protein
MVQGEAVQLVASGDAPQIKQGEEGASYEPIMKVANAQVKLTCYAVFVNLLYVNDKTA